MKVDQRKQLPSKPADWRVVDEFYRLAGVCDLVMNQLDHPGLGNRISTATAGDDQGGDSEYLVTVIARLENGGRLPVGKGRESKG